MQGSKVIGKSVRRFTEKRCSGIKLTAGAVLREGMTIKFKRESSEMGGLGFHESTHRVSSIQVNRDPRQEVTADDGVCAIKINGGASNVPPCGCVVLLVDDSIGPRGGRPYMVKSGYYI